MAIDESKAHLSPFIAQFATNDIAFKQQVLLMLAHLTRAIDGHDSLSNKATVAAAATDSVIQAAVAGKKIRVRAFSFFGGNSPTDIKFGSKVGAAATVDITPNFDNWSNTGGIWQYNPDGWMTTEVGGALVATTGAGTDTGVLFSYILV